MRARPFASALLLALLPALASGAPPAEDPPARDRPAAPPETARDGEIVPAKSTIETFLDDVDLLIGDEERQAYLALLRPYQKQAFIRRFWEVRDPYPQTARNELEERWTERLALARERYGGLADARSRMLLWNGEPGRPGGDRYFLK